MHGVVLGHRLGVQNGLCGLVCCAGVKLCEHTMHEMEMRKHTMYCRLYSDNELGLCEIDELACASLIGALDHNNLMCMQCIVENVFL